MFLTAKSSDEDMVLALGLGADAFLAKPIKLGASGSLIETVRGAGYRFTPHVHGRE